MWIKYVNLIKFLEQCLNHEISQLMVSKVHTHKEPQSQAYW